MHSVVGVRLTAVYVKTAKHIEILSLPIGSQIVQFFLQTKPILKVRLHGSTAR